MKLAAVKKTMAASIAKQKTKMQAKMAKFKAKMSAKMRKNAMAAALQTRMAAESAHAHISVQSNELASKAKTAREVATKARRAAMGMKGTKLTTSSRSGKRKAKAGINKDAKKQHIANKKAKKGRL